MRRPVGGAAIMKAQLHHIVEMAELNNVTVQVLPFDAGAHPAMTASFSLLGFDGQPDMNTVYLENGRGALYLEGAADLTRYNWIFQRLGELALSPAKSRQFTTTVAKQL